MSILDNSFVDLSEAQSVNETQRSIETGRRMSAADLTPQEYIKRYYEELEQLENQMKFKRQEQRLRAFGSLDQEEGSISVRLKRLEEEFEAEQ